MKNLFLALISLHCTCQTVQAAWYNPACWFTTTECYPPYGCFSDEKPFDNAACKIPDKPSKMGLQLFLFTKQNKDVGTLLDSNGNAAQLANSHYEAHKLTKFIIHGFTDSCDALWVHDIKDAFLSRFDYNVILVNWKTGAGGGYSKAAANTRLVAAMLAHFINFLNGQQTPFDNIHLIGHSLGAQISGQVGSNLGGKLGRITGLDPAGPYFDRESDLIRLDKTDAKFVDCMHTDGEHLIKLGLGMLRRMGHADFYPQGGYDQDHCAKTVFETLGEVLNGFDAVRTSAACSHNRATLYFKQSISPCEYLAFQCSSYDRYKLGYCGCTSYTPCNRMGYFAQNIPGQFFLFVNGTPPYCGV